MPGSFPDIIVNHAAVTQFDHKDFVIPRHKLKKGLCPGVKVEVYFPGFPTMKNIDHSVRYCLVSVVISYLKYISVNAIGPFTCS
jgi:5'-3' exoribonuclease 1